MNIGLYLKMVKDSETELNEALIAVADHHQRKPDMERSAGCSPPGRNRKPARQNASSTSMAASTTPGP